MLILLRALALSAIVMKSSALPAAKHDSSSRTSSDGCLAATRVTTIPERPRQGTLFRVQLVGAVSNARLSGVVAGEPLHFSQDSSGTWTALAPVPIDSVASLGVLVRCAISAAEDSLRIRIPIVAVTYPIEKLRVAPRFGAEPDSALAARLAREGRRAADVSLLSHDTPRMWTRPFVAPRASRITSRFGGGREFNGAVTSRHMGTDFTGVRGAEIRATNRGIVRLVDAFFLGGNVVYIDHGEGLVTAYLHQTKQLVSEGDTVERGQVIGRVGSTGRVTGPHLHFIVRYGGISVDPQAFLSSFGGRVPATRPPAKGASKRRAKSSAKRLAQ
ncbi:MAG: M23 family metallopeptidase [Gemmatimonadaceae bacterium]